VTHDGWLPPCGVVVYGSINRSQFFWCVPVVVGARLQAARLELMHGCVRRDFYAGIYFPSGTRLFMLYAESDDVTCVRFDGS
jgi:hypothetical protein